MPLSKEFHLGQLCNSWNLPNNVVALIDDDIKNVDAAWKDGHPTRLMWHPPPHRDCVSESHGIASVGVSWVLRRCGQRRPLIIPLADGGVSNPLLTAGMSSSERG